MKYAIISDVHSNLEALAAAVEDIRASGADRIICCGDVVGYGPQPEECCAILKSAGIICTLGNHDAALIGRLSISGFNEYALKAIGINAELISADSKLYISSLPERLCENGILFVHGSPRDPVNEYLSSVDKLRNNIVLIKERVCFHGHTHYPMVYSENESGSGNVERPFDGFSISLAENKKYIINVGSVGQPRDNDPRCCLVYFDTDTGVVVFRRIEYDVPAVQARMRAIGIPDFLVTRLLTGR
jgi:diadenosine tetraphosphatase ApaH/serine/threonine PP2A family protein phosphatase